MPCGDLCVQRDMHNMMQYTGCETWSMQPCGGCAASIGHDLLDIWVDIVQLPLFTL